METLNARQPSPDFGARGVAALRTDFGTTPRLKAYFDAVPPAAWL
jgi:hypothetical protein